MVEYRREEVFTYRALIVKSCVELAKSAISRSMLRWLGSRLEPEPTRLDSSANMHDSAMMIEFPMDIGWMRRCSPVEVGPRCVDYSWARQCDRSRKQRCCLVSHLTQCWTHRPQPHREARRMWRCRWCAWSWWLGAPGPSPQHTHQHLRQCSHKWSCIRNVTRHFTGQYTIRGYLSL